MLPAPRKMLVCLLLLGTLAAAGSAVAREATGIALGPVILSPSLGVQAAYDDNVTLSADDTIDDIVMRGLVRLDLVFPRRSLRAAPRPPSADLLLIVPTDVLPLIERYVLFPGDIERFVDAPPEVRGRDVRQREAFAMDLSYQLDGVFFLTSDEVEDTGEQIFSGATSYSFPGGLTLGAGGEWIDRTTSSSDIFDVAQFASDIRFAGADFNRGAAGVVAQYALSPSNSVDLSYAFFASAIDEEPFELFDFRMHQGAVAWRHERPSGVVLGLRGELGRIDGDASASAFREAGLVEPFVPLDFEGDPRAAYFYQGWAELTWPLGARLTGIGRVGAQARDFDESTFDNFVGLLEDAKLVYRFGAGSELRLRYLRTPIDVLGEDGAFLVRDQGQLAASLRLGRWWRLTASVDGGQDVFDEGSSLTGKQREDTFYGGLLGLDWHPSSWLVVQADYSGRVRTSNQSSEDTSRNRVRLRAVVRY